MTARDKELKAAKDFKEIKESGAYREIHIRLAIGRLDD